MTRLMCSNVRQEVETLKSKLFRAGIRSEIRGNPLAHAMGITRLELFVHERDLLRASEVRQRPETVINLDEPAGSPGGGRRINGPAEGEESELVIEAEVRPSSATQRPRDERPGRGPRTDGAEPEDEFAQATALLEKEVEELLAREGKLADRCCSLDEKVKALDESLAQARADLTREASKGSTSEQKLAEAGAARASLEKELQALDVRFKASEQALAASQARLELQRQESNLQLARIADLTKEVSSRDAQLERMAGSLADARAGMEREKDLRLAAEQESRNRAAALKSLECQLGQEAQQREQLLSERREEHEQLQACVGKVNDLRSRLKAKPAAKKK